MTRRDATARLLLEGNMIGTFVWHVDGRVLETNDEFLRIIGYERDELLSGEVHWSAFTSPLPSWQERMVRDVQTTRETGLGEPREWEYIRKDGNRVPVLVGGAHFARGSTEGVAFVLDLRAIKRAESSVRDSERHYHELELQLAETKRIGGIAELSASIAHEVNQPLLGIITNATTCLKLLAAEVPNLALVAATVRRTLRDGHRATEIITRLRELFARRETTFESLALNDLALEVFALAANELRRENVTLVHELEASCFVRGDRIQLQQVMLNLLRNGLDAMRGVRTGRKELVIRTERNGDGRVSFMVRDSGIGLEPGDPERLFDAFQTTKKSGLGIGLFVSRAIIARHHGKLWAERNCGRGATLIFSLPAAG